MEFDLLRQDCSVPASRQLVRLVLRKGKSDMYNLGSTRHIMAAAPGAVFCPVQFVERYLRHTTRFPQDQPLLRRDDGKFVTREAVVAVLKRHGAADGFDAAHISGHSLRIGAATALKERDVSESDIMFWGQWATASSMMRYVRGTAGRAALLCDALDVSPAPRVGLLQGEVVQQDARFGAGGLQSADVLSSRVRRS